MPSLPHGQLDRRTDLARGQLGAQSCDDLIHTQQAVLVNIQVGESPGAQHAQRLINPGVRGGLQGTQWWALVGVQGVRVEGLVMGIVWSAGGQGSGAWGFRVE